MTDSQKLLAEYVRSGSEAAFRELVTRYLDLVYSAALRLVGGDAHLAEDVAQTVFVDLARMARALSKEVMLGGWLHRHTCFVAANTMRGERRRQFRERQAVEMNMLQDNSGADFSLAAPVLDEAINELGEADRIAILLRFFEQRDFRSVGEALGGNEDAARMRVNRALERLQSLLKRRGVTSSAAAFGVVLSTNAVQAAPVGLAAAISTAAALAGGAASTSTVIATTKATITTMHWLNAKAIIATFVTLAAVAVVYLAQQREVNRVRGENRSLIAQQELLASERDAAINDLSALRDENERLKRNTAELLKLRGELTQLRRQPGVSAETAQSETNSLPNAEEAQIHIAAKFVSIPADALNAMGFGWTSSAQGGRTALLTEQQFKVLNEAMQGAGDVNVISSPEVITLNGRQTQLFVTQTVVLKGTNADVGTSLDVIPYLLTNASAFDLHLIAELRQLSGDASSPYVQIVQATNRATLSPGQTLVFEEPIPNGGWLPDSTNIASGPRNLLVFVTPQVVDSRGFPVSPPPNLSRLQPSP